MFKNFLRDSAACAAKSDDIQDANLLLGAMGSWQGGTVAAGHIGRFSSYSPPSTGRTRAFRHSPGSAAALAAASAVTASAPVADEPASIPAEAAVPPSSSGLPGSPVLGQPIVDETILSTFFEGKKRGDAKVNAVLRFLAGDGNPKYDAVTKKAFSEMHEDFSGVLSEAQMRWAGDQFLILKKNEKWAKFMKAKEQEEARKEKARKKAEEIMKLKKDLEDLEAKLKSCKADSHKAKTKLKEFQDEQTEIIKEWESMSSKFKEKKDRVDANIQMQEAVIKSQEKSIQREEQKIKKFLAKHRRDFNSNKRTRGDGAGTGLQGEAKRSCAGSNGSSGSSIFIDLD
eukprot:g3998.t1